MPTDDTNPAAVAKRLHDCAYELYWRTESIEERISRLLSDCASLVADIDTFRRLCGETRCDAIESEICDASVWVDRAVRNAALLVAKTGMAWRTAMETRRDLDESGAALRAAKEQKP